MYVGGMRTTVDLDDDTTAAIDDLRRSKGLGLSEAVNALIRRGLVAGPARTEFRQETRDLGLRIDVSNVAEALDVLDGSTAR